MLVVLAVFLSSKTKASEQLDRVIVPRIDSTRSANFICGIFNQFIYLIVSWPFFDFTRSRYSFVQKRDGPAPKSTSRRRYYFWPRY